MISWTSTELSKLEKADELELAAMKEEGTFRKPVTIWVVRVGDNIYVRSYLGRNSAWFRGTQICHVGHISAGGIAKNVKFVDVSGDETLNSDIDAAYRSKYRNYSADYVDPMVAPQARAATLKLVPTQ